jgi:hypothetical protein
MSREIQKHHASWLFLHKMSLYQKHVKHRAKFYKTHLSSCAQKAHFHDKRTVEGQARHQKSEAMYGIKLFIKRC